MGIKGIIFMAVAIFAAITNFSSHRISGKTGVSELKIKLFALAVIIAAVSLLMIFGK